MHAPFVRPGRGLHLELDEAALMAAFADAPADATVPFAITSGFHRCVWQRARAFLPVPTGRRVAADLFLWGIGEAPDRRMTKIGGAPYLPAATPWPEIEGLPATFLGQLSFLDSRDLLPALPGDVLLVFVRDENGMYDGAFRCVWVKDAEVALWRAEDVPMPAWQFATTWGVRDRWFDDGAGQAVFDDPPGAPYDTWRSPIASATKIGGVPYSAQDSERIARGHTFLGQIATVQAAPEVAWPWVNQAEAMALYSTEPTSSIHHTERSLSIADMGRLTLTMDPDGAVAVHITG